MIKKTSFERKVLHRSLALFLALALALALSLSLVACKKENAGDAERQAPAPPDDGPVAAAVQPAQEAAPAEEPALTVGCDFFSQQFNPFFAKTVTDRQVAVDMTQLLLVSFDRSGTIVAGGIGGETIPYDGADYSYIGPADIQISHNSDGTAEFSITLRDDLLFSDGLPVTIDDVIFSMYVYLDPDYDGPSAFSSLPITGLPSYRAGVSPEIYDKYERIAGSILEAGPYNTDYADWTQEQQETFWGECLERAGASFIREIVAYCVENYPSTLEYVSNSAAALGMYLRGFANFDGNGAFVTINGAEYDLTNGKEPSIADFWDELVTEYGLDLSDGGINGESLGSDIKSLVTEAFIAAEGSKDPGAGAGAGAGAAGAAVSGIRKTGPYSCTVSTDYFEAAFIHGFAFAIAPLHYYGDESLYDFDRSMFGFPKGDLSMVGSKTAAPMGAGPYRFLSYDGGVVSFEANESYYKGEPKIKQVRFREAGDAEKLAGIAFGSLDISAPAFTGAVSAAIEGSGSNGEMAGDKIAAVTFDHPGYGYIGISADAVKSGDDPGSRASRDLRRAFATLFAVQRDTAVGSYFGERASIIQYPSSQTSWIAPRPGDEGYRIAYSTDVDGKGIFSEGMDEKDRKTAALSAAIGFFKAAGYVWDETSGKFTEAPPGARMSYAVIIPAGGIGDHPAYGILSAAKEALASIGITLEIIDTAEADYLWKAVESGEAGMWAAAWEVSADPDLYGYYHSSSIATGGGAGSNYYAIDDETLDMRIIEARAGGDPANRKAAYKQCLEMIMDWAVEVPLYQRKDVVLFSAERIDPGTIAPDITAYYTWLSDIELLAMK